MLDEIIKHRADENYHAGFQAEAQRVSNYWSVAVYPTNQLLVPMSWVAGIAERDKPFDVRRQGTGVPSLTLYLLPDVKFLAVSTDLFAKMAEIAKS